MAIEDTEPSIVEAANQLGGSKKRAGKQSVNTDSKQFTKLNDELKVLKRTVGEIRDQIKGLTKDANGAMGAVSGMAGAAGGQATTAAGNPRATTTGKNTSVNAPTQSTRGSSATPPGGGAGINTGGNFGGMRGFTGGMTSRAATNVIGGYIGAQIAGQVIGGMDQRIDRGAQYAASADRLSVTLQQQYGMSQMGVMQGLRQPLTNYRLGVGGVNEMLQFQSSTGVNAANMAGSVEGLRALTGYSKSTQGVLQDQKALMDPTVANRMFMMLGTNAYTTGGGVNDPTKMIQQITQRMGLNNKDILKSAKMPGSVTRARMTDAGIPVNVQDDVLKYAEANQSFKDQGGQGMYDLKSKKDRERMGIEGNFATEIEETDRLRGAREEQFMERQIDNLESMEKNTQTMVKLLGGIEDKISGAFGARASTRGIQRMAGSILQAGGAAAMFAPIPGARIAGAAAMIGGGALSASGDPENADAEGGGVSSPSINTKNSGNDGNVSVPFGYGDSKVSLNDLKSKSTFQGMNPKMRQRLLAMMRASGGRVGIGTGLRDSGVQEAMFRDRYRPDPNGEVSWNGQKWKRVKGAPAAPPGRSMHEIGLAADLVGDLDWVQANAGRFGLKTFANVNNEPWHVQPTELPNSRRKYEEGGAQWGSDGGFEEDSDFGTTSSDNDDVAEHVGDGGNYGGSAMGIRGFAGMSISDIISAMDEDGINRLMSSPGFSRGSSTSETQKALDNLSSGPALASIGGGAEGASAAAQAAFNAGFRGEDLFKIVSIAGRESGWKNTMRSDTSDTGMWQINWSANEEIARSVGASDREDLLDVNLNARAAYELFQRSGWHGWKASSHSEYLIARGMGPKGWDPNGDPMWNTGKHQDAATEAIKALNQSGDPMPIEVAMPNGPSRSPGRGTMGVQSPVSVSQPITIEVRPEINFVGQPQHSDLNSIAHKVTSLIEQGVKEMEMRTA